MASQNQDDIPQMLPHMTLDQLKAYFLLIKEAANKRERHDIRRECFQVFDGGKGRHVDSGAIPGKRV